MKRFIIRIMKGKLDYWRGNTKQILFARKKEYIFFTLVSEIIWCNKSLSLKVFSKSIPRHQKMTRFSGIHRINVSFSKKFDYWDKTISKDECTVYWLKQIKIAVTQRVLLNKIILLFYLFYLFWKKSSKSISPNYRLFITS